MNKMLSFSLLVCMHAAAPIFACERGAISGTNGAGPFLSQEMVAINIAPEKKEIGTQTEATNILQDFELIDVREVSSLSNGRSSIGTQLGALQESTYESVRRAMKDDGMEKEMAMKKKWKYIGPCYCIFIGGFIYLNYFLPK